MLAARLRHPNVVSTLDVTLEGEELVVVTEHVIGATLASLLDAARRERVMMPLAIVASVLSGALQALHAAHEARDEHGRNLGIVHRDVRPDNILVGADGVARLMSFGLSKASQRLAGGVSAYMAPEQVDHRQVDRRADVFSIAAVFWEALTGKRLLPAEAIEPPSQQSPELSAGVDAIVLCGLERDPAERYPTANAMAIDVERAMPIATQRQVAQWMERFVGEELRAKTQTLADFERVSLSELPPASCAPRRSSYSLPAPPVQPKRNALAWVAVIVALGVMGWVGYKRMRPAVVPSYSSSSTTPSATIIASVPVALPSAALAVARGDDPAIAPSASGASPRAVGSSSGVRPARDAGGPNRLYLRD
jgi:serine/threonine-protein kinase